MKKRFIFDLDNTLIKTDYSLEHVFFNNVFPGNDFDNYISKYLDEYEYSRIIYDEEDLCRFLSDKTGYLFNKKILSEWQEFAFNYDEEIIFGAVDILEELKFNDKEIVVLTNWFSKCQIDRLKRSDLLQYIDCVYGGDIYLKPQKYAFINACNGTNIEECIMIGDTYKKDILGAESIGLNALLYDEEGKSNYKQKIKSLYEIKKWI